METPEECKTKASHGRVICAECEGCLSVSRASRYKNHLAADSASVWLTALWRSHFIGMCSYLVFAHFRFLLNFWRQSMVRKILMFIVLGKFLRFWSKQMSNGGMGRKLVKCQKQGVKGIIKIGWVWRWQMQSLVWWILITCFLPSPVTSS